MSLPLALPIWSLTRSALPAWSPAQIALTGWWRAPYAGSPWSDTASAGTSGSRTASQATYPAAVGENVNGFAAADFDGVSKFLSLNDTYGAYCGSDAFSGFAIIKIRSLPALSTPQLSSTILCTTGTGRLVVYCGLNGSVFNLRFCLFNSAGVGIIATMAFDHLGAYAVIHWSYDGTNIKVGVNGVWSSPAAAGAPHAGNASVNLELGRNTDQTKYLDASLLELGLAATIIGDDDIGRILEYAQAHYDLALSLPPHIDSVDPIVLSPDGGTVVTITGSRLTDEGGNAKVFVGSEEQAIVSASASEIVFESGPMDPDSYVLSVDNHYGTSNKVPVSVVAPFDPSSLPLSGWWRDYPGNNTLWTGSASAGTSGDGSHNIPAASTTPSAGAPLNGHGVAEGASGKSSLSPAGNLGNYASSYAWSGWALVCRPAANSTVEMFGCGNTGTSDAIHASANYNTSNGYYETTKYYSGGNQAINSDFVASSAQEWHLYTWRYDGTNIQSGIDGPPNKNKSRTSALALSASMGVQVYPTGALLAEIGCSASVLTDQNFNDIKSYVNARYELAL